VDDDKNPKQSKAATESTLNDKLEMSPLSDALQPGRVDQLEKDDRS
jgi:hypothetical protein